MSDENSIQHRLQLLENKRLELVERIRVLSLDNREHKHLIESLLEKTPFGIFIMDSNRRLIRMNHAAEQILHLRRVTSIGKECTQFFTCYQQRSICPVLDDSKQFDREETCCSLPTMSDTTLLRSTVLMSDKGEKIVLEAFIDISEIKRAQKLIIDANRSKDEFLAMMSHELRTPLNAIIGYTELLAEDLQEQGNPTHMKYIGGVKTAGVEMLRLVQQLLDFSQLQANRLSLSISSFDIQPLLEEVQTMVQPLLDKNHNRFSVRYNDKLRRLTADRGRLLQVLLILVDNACKFTQQGDIMIEMETAEAQGLAIFHIRDTGVGIEAEKQALIFQAFEQVDKSSTRKYGGVGLGLAIAKELTLLLQGELSLESSCGTGSCFTLQIPIVAKM